MDKLAQAIIALAVTLLGIGLALVAFKATSTILPVVVVTSIVALVLGGILFLVGQRMLPLRPVSAVYLMEWWILIPLVFAVAASAAIIGAGVWLEPPTDATVENKKLLAATFAALSGFLTTSIVEYVTKAEGSLAGTPIKKAFETAYNSEHGYDLGNEDNQKWVFDDGAGGVPTGWGFSARRTRAREVKRILDAS